MDILPPISDDRVERIRFDSFMYNELQNRKRLLDTLLEKHSETGKRVFSDIEVMGKTIEEMDHVIRHTDTRNKTLVATAVVVWTFLSGAVAWVWDKGTSKAEEHVVIVRQLTDDVKVANSKIVSLESEIAILKGVRGQILTIQDDIQVLQRGKK